MHMIEYWTGKVQKMTMWDLKLAQLWSALWMLLLIKLFPRIMELGSGWILAGLLLCAPRLIYIFFIRKDNE